MSLNREIQDFLGAYKAVDTIATNASKRAYYRQKAGGPNSPTNPNSPAGVWVNGQAGPAPPGVQTQAPSGGVLQRAGRWIGQQFGGQSGGGGTFGSGALSYSGDPGGGGGNPYADPGDPDFNQTYDDGGSVLPPGVEPGTTPPGTGAPQVDTTAPMMPSRGAVPISNNGSVQGGGGSDGGTGGGGSSGDYAEGGDVLPPYQYPGQSSPPPDLPAFDYPGQGAAQAPVTPGQEPPISLPERPASRGAVPVTPKGKPARKPLGDQTRTEAYDPDQDGPGAVPTTQGVPAQGAVPLNGSPTTPQSGDMAGNAQAGQSTNNARSDLEQALHGGMTFAQDTFHLNDPNDPHHPGGKQALFSGVGAADPALIKQVDQKVNNGVPYDPQLYNVRRLEAIYRWYSMNGETDKANKAAFELMQYSAGVASQWGARAVDQYKQGDMPGAIKSVQEGYNHIPDGNHMTVQGSTATIVDSRTGKPVNQFQFTPEQVFNAAMGLDSRALYWQVLGQRVSSTTKGQRTQTPAQEDLTRARTKYIEARTGQVGKAKGSAAGPSDATKALIDRINAEEPGAGGAQPPKGSASTAPAEASPVNDDAAAPIADDDETGINAGGKPTQADTVAPDSVLRIKPPQPGSAAAPVTSEGSPPAPASPSQGNHPGYEEGVTHGPDHVPDVTVGRDGENYVPATKRGQPDAFTEEAPKPNPYGKYVADAAKLPPKERVAVMQVIQKKAAAYDKQAATYGQRKKAFDAAEGKRVDSEFKAAAQKQKDELKAVLGYNLRPADTEAIERDVTSAYSTAQEKNPEGVKAFGDPGQVKRIAYELAKMNKLPAEEALRIAGQLTSIDKEQPFARTYQPRGRDVLGNIVVTTPSDGPLHIPPHVYKNMISVIQSKGRADQGGKDAQAAAAAAPKPMDKIREAGAALKKALPPPQARTSQRPLEQSFRD